MQGRHSKDVKCSNTGGKLDSSVAVEVSVSQRQSIDSVVELCGRRPVDRTEQ